MAEPDYKAMVVASRAADLLVSPAITGTPASWLKPSLVKAGYDLDDLGAPAQRDYGGDPAKKWRDLWAAGQGLHAIAKTEPLADIVDTLEDGWDAARLRLQNFGRDT